MQLRYQRRIYTPSLVFYQQPLWFLKTNITFGHQAEVTYKVRKSVCNIEMYFKQFFTCLERNPKFITSIFRTIYRSSSPEVLSKKGVPLQMCSMFTEEYRWRQTFAWMWKWMQHMLAGIHLFRVKIEKLEQGVKYVQS